MFGLRLQIRLKQASNALRDGRLDEAYSLVTASDIAEHRGGQVLRERLVEPLLDRAEGHLDAERLQAALLDVERAFALGGNRPRAAKLRDKVRAAIDARRDSAERKQALVDSARAHLANGSLHAGLARLDDAAIAGATAEQLKRLLQGRERVAIEARAQALASLERGEIEAALDAARRAVGAHPRDGALPDLLATLKREALERLGRAVDDGNLRLADGLAEQLRPLFGDHLEVRGLDDALAAIRKAAVALRAHAYDEARVALGRVRRLRPQAAWIGEALADLETLSAALHRAESGPLGLLASAGASTRMPGAAAEAAAPAPSRPATPAEQRGDPLTARRLLLWVDGIGTYLLLVGDRVSIGRAGSSSHPDVALQADLSGHHAEILRVEDDYFIVAAQGAVKVDSHEVKKKLLCNNDRIDLGAGCQLTFHQASPLSTTAIIGLHRGQRVERDVRKIVLFDRELLIGARSSCHIQAPMSGAPAVLSLRGGVLRCRATEDIVVDGRVSASPRAADDEADACCEAEVPLGAHVEIGKLSFTVTSPSGEGSLP